MAAAMVLSVGTFAGFSSQPQKDTQCLCVGCLYFAANSGSVAGEVAWAAGSVVTGNMAWELGGSAFAAILAGGPFGLALAGCVVAGA